MSAVQGKWFRPAVLPLQFVAALLLASNFAASVWAQPPVPVGDPAAVVGKGAAEPTTSPESFFRMLVPEKRLDEIPDFRIPMKRQAFEKRLAELNGSQVEVVGTQQARILSGDYSIRFDGRQLQGEAHLEIVRDGEKTVFLPLDPLNMAVTSALWEDENPRSASIGRGPSGKTGVLVETSGRLKIGWTLCSSAADATSFTLQLPEALVNQLEVQAPPNFRLSAAEAYVTKMPAPAANNALDGGTPESRTWHVLLGRKSRTTLNFELQSTPQVTEPRVVWRERSEYDISPSSIECLSTWLLDVSRAPLTELVLQGDAAASLADIRLGNKSLTWSIQSKPTGWTAVVPLPEPLWGPSRQVVVRTVSTSTLGQKQPLPRVKLAGSDWHAGDVTVRLNDSLRIEDVNITPGRIVFANWEAPGSQEVRLQAFTEDYRADAVVHRRAGRPSLTTATLIQIDALQMNAVVQGELSADDPRFLLQAVLPRAWVLDSVDTIPADLLEDRVITSINGGAQRVDIHLRRAASEENPLRFVVRAHRRRPPGAEPISCKNLRVLEVPSADAEKIIAVDVLDPTAQLQYTGDARLKRLEEADLSEVEAELLPSLGVLLFRDNEQATELELRLEPRRPRFVASTNVQVAVEPDRLDYFLSARCTPEGTPPRKLLVHLAAASSQTIEWQGSGTLGEVTARPVVGTGKEPGENWLVEWSRTPVGPFEITARFSRSMEEQQNLPLLSLPEATSQRGVVEVLSNHAGLFALESNNPQPLPTTAMGEVSARVRARLRYDPPSSESIILRSLPASLALPAVRCERAQLASRVGTEGNALHELKLQLANDGGGALRFRLPGGKLLQSLVDGRELEVEEVSIDGSNWYSAQLPDESRQLKVDLTYSTEAQSGRLTPFSRWGFPLPELDLPVAHREWQIWIPPGLELLPWPTRIVPQENAEQTTVEPTTAVASSGLGDGWSIHAVHWPVTGPAVIAVARPTGVLSLKLGTMFIVLGLLYSCRLAGRGWSIPFVLLLMGATWFVPPGWDWLFHGIAWGVLAACWIVAVRGSRDIMSPSKNEPISGGKIAAEAHTTLLPHAATLARIVAWIGLTFIISTAVSWLPIYAQQAAAPIVAPPMTSPPTVANAAQPGVVAVQPKPLYMVVDPVDDQGRATGDYVYVSPEFLKLLEQDPARGLNGELDWLLQSAEYRAIFRATTLPEEECQFDAFEVQWELQVLKAGARIRLPMTPAQFEVIGAGQLNGASIQIDWQKALGEMSFVVPTAGRHLLRLQLRPLVETTPQGRRANIQIPRNLTGRLTIEGSSLVPEITCKAGPFRIVRRQGEGELSSSFGSTEQLEFTWRPASAEQPTSIVGEQLAWWRLRPNGVTVETRLRLRPAQGKITSFVMDADPRLRPLAPEGGLKVQQIASDEVKQSWRFDLPQPVEREVVFPVTFQLMEVTPIGRFSIPRLDLRVDRLDRSWAAISPSADLRLQIEKPAGDESAMPVAPLEFLASWRDSNASPPELAFPASDAEYWSIAVQPALPLLQVTERISLSVLREHQRLRYEAKLTNADNSFLHRLNIPPTMKLELVAVWQEGEVIPSEWNLQKNGALTVMVARPNLPGLRTIVVEGTLPPLANGVLAMVKLAGGEVTRSEWSLFEGENVEFKPEPATGWEVDVSERGKFVAEWGRLVETWTATGIPRITANSPGKGRVIANESQASGTLQIEVVRDNEGWFADVELQFDIASGAIDHLRLEFPREWTPTIEDESDIELEVREIPGRLHKQLWLRPERPWTGHQKIKLHGSLVADTDGIRAPDVRMLEPVDWQRTVLLPQRFDKQAIHWSVSGLIESTPAANLNLDPISDTIQYSIPGPRFVAVVDSIQRAAEEPKALLAVAHLWPGSDGRLPGLVQFELVPNGRSVCLLHVPPEVDLAQITIDGQSAVCRLRQGGTWELLLESAELPQLIAVSFECRTSLKDGLQQATLPMLVGMPVARTIWHIHSDEQGQSAPTETKFTPPLEIANRNLAQQAAFSLLETQIKAVQIAAQSDFVTKWPEFTRPWLQARSKRWQELQQDWDIVLDGDSSPQLKDVRERMNAAEKLFPKMSSVATDLKPSPNEPQDLGFRPADTVHVFDHWMGRYPLQPSTAEVNPQWAGAGLWGGFLLIGSLIVAVLLQRWGWEEVLSAHPTWLLAIAGGIAILFVSPSWIGWGLLAFAMTLEIIQKRPAKVRRSAASTTIVPRQSTIIPK